MLLDPRQVDGLPSLRDSIRVAKPVVAKDLPFRRNRNFQVPGGSGSRNRRVRRRGRRGCSWGRCWGSGFGRRRSRRRRIGVTVTIQGSPFTAAVRCEPSVRLRDLNDGTLSAAGGNRLLRRAAKTAEPLPGALGAAWSGVKSWRNFCADQPGPSGIAANGRWGVAVGWGVRVIWCAVAKPGKTAARMRMGAANAIASEILLAWLVRLSAWIWGAVNGRLSCHARAGAAMTCPRCLRHPLCASDRRGDRVGRQEGVRRRRHCVDAGTVTST